jgi:phage tail protein X
MTDYTTLQGDTWDIIAFRVYGDEKQMSTLIEANPGQRFRVVFPAGTVLTVPTIASEATVELPPWRRG